MALLLVEIAWKLASHMPLSQWLLRDLLYSRRLTWNRQNMWFVNKNAAVICPSLLATKYFLVFLILLMFNVGEFFNKVWLTTPEMGDF